MSRTVSVVDTVVPRQIARRFAGGDDVIDSHSVFRMRERDFLDLGSQRTVDVESRADCLFHLAVESADKVLSGNADLKSGQRLFDFPAVIRNRAVDRSRIAAV